MHSVGQHSDQGSTMQRTAAPPPHPHPSPDRSPDPTSTPSRKSEPQVGTDCCQLEPQCREETHTRTYTRTRHTLKRKKKKKEGECLGARGGGRGGGTIFVCRTLCDAICLLSLQDGITEVPKFCAENCCPTRRKAPLVTDGTIFSGLKKLNCK